MKGALSDWYLEEPDVEIILNIQKMLKKGEDKEKLEERLYIQLEHLDVGYPLKKLFSVLSKKY